MQIQNNKFDVEKWINEWIQILKWNKINTKYIQVLSREKKSHMGTFLQFNSPALTPSNNHPGFIFRPQWAIDTRLLNWNTGIQMNTLVPPPPQTTNNNNNKKKYKNREGKRDRRRRCHICNILIYSILSNLTWIYLFIFILCI